MKYFDLQVNGAFGVDFSSPELTEDDFLRSAEKILERGCTRFLPTVVTSSDELYRRNLPLINHAVETHGLRYAMPGFHLEGPFISPKPGAVGAHNPDWTLMPSIAALDNLLDIAGGMVSLLTVAAELPGIRELTGYAKSKGIKVSLGHELADREEILSAGADAMTHLGNGIPNMIDRHRNPVWTGLAADQLTVMAITDGHHLPADVLKCFLRCKGMEQFIAVSDASSVAGLPPGRYHSLGNDAVLEENGLFHNPEKECLVGSSYLLADCAGYLRKELHLTEPEIEKICWLNPHRLLGLPV